VDASLEIQPEIYLEFRQKISKPGRFRDRLGIRNQRRYAKQRDNQNKFYPNFPMIGHINKTSNAIFTLVLYQKAIKYSRGFS